MRLPFEESQERDKESIGPMNTMEIARLVQQDYLFASGMGGLFPRQIDLSCVHRVLDLACGPGGWTLEVARTYPKLQVVGIDASNHMIEYAQAQAWVQQMKNVEFRRMNVLEALDIPDNAFDVINAQFIVSFLPKDAWPRLIQECLRITHPGGVLRLTEAEMSFSNSAACERLNSLFASAIHTMNRGFSPHGWHLSITPMLSYFLREGGYENVQSAAHTFDYSTGMKAHDAFYQNFILSYQRLKPFLLQANVCTSEEFEQLFEQAKVEMSSETFCGVCFYLSTWGTKRGKASTRSVFHQRGELEHGQKSSGFRLWEFPGAGSSGLRVKEGNAVLWRHANSHVCPTAESGGTEKLSSRFAVIRSLFGSPGSVKGGNIP